MFRIGKDSKLSPLGERKKKPSPEMFQPSSADAESGRISVWVESLTVADEGWSMMGSNPKYTSVACLITDKIVAMTVPDTFQPLAPQWERAMRKHADGSKTPNTHPGAEGHAGIWGLLQGGDGRADKDRRKKLRSDLADLASLSPVPVPHDIPEEEIAKAAYFISASHEGSGKDHATHWVMAIRQLRRARVQADRDTSE